MVESKIINGDCRKELKKLGDNSVELTITSPPYNLGESCRGKKTVDMYKEYEDDLPEKRYESFMTEVIEELIRVTEWYTFFNFQLLTNNQIAYFNIMEKFKYNIKDIIVWHKKQVQPAIQPTCLSSAFEFVLILTEPKQAIKRTFKRANFNNRMKGQKNNNVIYGDSATKEYNPTTNRAVFPKYFVRWFLKRFAKEGDTILDPFAGTFTVASVAKEFKCDSIGIELSKDYCDYAKSRLKQKTLW